MARYNEILVGRFNRAIQKLTGIKGIAPAPQLTGEIQAVLPMFFGAENRYVDSWNRFAIEQAMAAGGVGVTNGIRLQNPAGNNVVAVIESIKGTNILTDVIQVRYGVGAIGGTFATIAAAQSLDNRQSGGSALTISVGASIPGGGVFIDSRNFAAATYVEFILTDFQELALTPNSVLSVVQQTANQAVTISIKWRERFLEESERF